MPHETQLIATIAIAFCLAMVLGYLAHRLRMPPLVGYLLAGVCIGPFTPGFVGDVGLAGQLAEIGVMLLMFGVGMHFSIGDLMQVRRIAVPGALVQITVATLMGTVAGHAWGWTYPESVLFGLCLSVASTVVALKALEARGELNAQNGRIIVGWLVVEDMVMVLVLVLVPALAAILLPAGGAGSAPSLGALALSLSLTLGKVVAFVALMLLVGRRLLPQMLWWVAKTGSKELFTLCVLTMAIGTAFGAAALFEVSFALGAFFAGMMMRESEYSHRAADESLPLRDAFAVLFFVSVGMLFEPQVLWREPLKLLVVAAIIMFGNALCAAVVMRMSGRSIASALLVGVTLGQIGEFSFILASLAVSLKLLPLAGQSLVLAGAIVSIAGNTLLFAALAPLTRWLSPAPAQTPAGQQAAPEDALTQLPELPTLPAGAADPPDPLQQHIVIAGWGKVGRRVSEQLSAQGLNPVILEHDRELVKAARQQGLLAVAGDTSLASVLATIKLEQAATLAITFQDPAHTRSLVQLARSLNPGIAILMLAQDEEEADLLLKEELGSVFWAESELARSMTAHIALKRGQPA